MRIKIGSRVFYSGMGTALFGSFFFVIALVTGIIIWGYQTGKYVPGSAGVSCSSWITTCATHRPLRDCLPDAYALGCRQ